MDHVSRLSHWLADAATRAAASVGVATSGAASPPTTRAWQLWREACAGQAVSATRLVRDLTPQAYGLAIQLVGKPEDAQDAVQDAFLRLWRSNPSDTHGARLSTYFNTIVLNCCRSLITGRREQPTDHEALTELHDAQQVRDGPPGVGHETASAAASHAGLQDGLARLPARQRMAIAMWAYADASVADIARALDIDPNAAHQLLHRAKLALRTHLERGTT